MSPLGQTRKVALITGASSGIGAAFARQSAAMGYDLILVARRVQQLKALAEAIESSSKARVEIFQADLTDDSNIRLIEKRIESCDNLQLLINNAGFAKVQRFWESPVNDQIQMVNLHIEATLRLCHAAIPKMICQGTGRIINVASINAFMSTKYGATYAATKAWLIRFSESLQLDLHGTGIKVQALCPGMTDTAFHESYTKDLKNSGRIPKSLWMSPEEVVRKSLTEFRMGKVTCVTGIQNRLLILFANSSLKQLLLAVIMLKDWFINLPISISCFIRSSQGSSRCQKRDS